MLTSAKRLTNPDVINAVRLGLPLPRGFGSYTLGELNTIERFIHVLDRKESNTLHGKVDWTRPAVEIIYNWCVAYRYEWDDLGSYQRFLDKVGKLKPSSIVTVEDYSVYFAAIFYEIKHNVECAS